MFRIQLIIKVIYSVHILQSALTVYVYKVLGYFCANLKEWRIFRFLYFYLIGLLLLGGPDDEEDRSEEFWSPTTPDFGCVLPDLPEEMSWGPTVNLVLGNLVACHGGTCFIYNNGSWQHLQDMMEDRIWHSSATTSTAVLLLGGYHSSSGAGNIITTELMPVDGTSAFEGPFHIRHGWDHCTIQLSETTFLLTGGRYTTDLVTEYTMEGMTRNMTNLLQGRAGHACSMYVFNQEQVSSFDCPAPSSDAKCKMNQARNHKNINFLPFM